MGLRNILKDTVSKQHETHGKMTSNLSGFSRIGLEESSRGNT